MITGEGRFDEQSLEGKLAGEIARRCRAARIHLHVIAGVVIAFSVCGPEARGDMRLTEAGRIRRRAAGRGRVDCPSALAV